jgi:hypothetical protein
MRNSCREVSASAFFFEVDRPNQDWPVTSKMIKKKRPPSIPERKIAGLAGQLVSPMKKT